MDEGYFVNPLDVIRLAGVTVKVVEDLGRTVKDNAYRWALKDGCLGDLSSAGQVYEKTAAAAGAMEAVVRHLSRTADIGATGLFTFAGEYQKTDEQTATAYGSLGW